MGDGAAPGDVDRYGDALPVRRTELGLVLLAVELDDEDELRQENPDEMT